MLLRLKKCALDAQVHRYGALQAVFLLQLCSTYSLNFSQKRIWILLNLKGSYYTVFENQRKSIIQHCERSELRLHFEWTKINWKCQKWSILASFWKPEICGQTVLPDRSVLKGQKLVENAKIKKFKCDILSKFQTMCTSVRVEIQTKAHT